jgi:hypothetical protein
MMTDRWKRLCWTEDGDIDVRRQVFAHSDLPTTIEREANLRAMLVAVWADAYTHGWSDGKAGREPNDRENPYTRWNPTEPAPFGHLSRANPDDEKTMSTLPEMPETAECKFCRAVAYRVSPQCHIHGTTRETP